MPNWFSNKRCKLGLKSNQNSNRPSQRARGGNADMLEAKTSKKNFKGNSCERQEHVSTMQHIKPSSDNTIIWISSTKSPRPEATVRSIHWATITIWHPREIKQALHLDYRKSKSPCFLLQINTQTMCIFGFLLKSIFGSRKSCLAHGFG